MGSYNSERTPGSEFLKALFGLCLLQLPNKQLRPVLVGVPGQIQSHEHLLYTRPEGSSFSMAEVSSGSENEALVQGCGVKKFRV